MWTLKIPPKIRIFLWKIQTLPHCFTCGASEADTKHFFCTYVKHALKDLDVCKQIKQGRHLAKIDLLRFLVTESGILSLDQLAILMWGIWRQVCNLKHDEGFRDR